jgi:hypothetical protein
LLISVFCWIIQKVSIHKENKSYRWINKDFDCEYREEVVVKNRGMMKMYFVNVTKERSEVLNPESALEIYCI